MDTARDDGHVDDPLATSEGGSDLRLRILRKYAGLSPAQRRVADTALRLGQGLLDRTIADLAQESRVSEPTVVRFCNTVGFHGIKDLKRAAIPLARTEGASGERIGLSEVDTEEALVTFVVEHMTSVLRETSKTLDLTAVAQAVTLLQRTRTVKVAAFGGSAVAARHAQHYLRRMGIPCTSFSVYDPHDIGLERYDRGDVVLAISRSGSDPLIVDIVADAKSKGASIICITSWGENRLHALADVSLQTPFRGPGILDGQHALERTAQIAVLNVLIAGLALNRQRLDAVEAGAGVPEPVP
jgi:RpiR family transcriptional regulator, carbohydrate utilization regulator